MARNFYAVLGLPQNATQEQIRARFRKLVRERHPDRIRGDGKEQAEVEFQAITEAFNILVNPERRRLHDLELAQPDQRRRGGDPGQLARVYLQRGIKAYKAKNYLEAAENFDRATKVQPQSAKAWHHLALAASHQRRWLARAKEAAERACELQPMNATYLKLAGRIAELAGMPTRALKHYEEALQWSGGDAELEQSIESLRAAVKKSKPGLFGKMK